MSEIFQKRILAFFPLGITIPKALIHDPNDATARSEFWDKYSFCNVNDLSIKCLLEHDSKQEIAATSRGTLRLWITNKALNCEILPEKNNPVNENIFFRMQDPGTSFGVSPGYHSAQTEKIMANGSKLKRVQLTEVSLTL